MKPPTEVGGESHLLQWLIYLDREGHEPRKLTCNTPNANRARGGVAYYCISGTALNILCSTVDLSIGTASTPRTG